MARQRRHRRVDYTEHILKINEMFIKPLQRYLGLKFEWEDAIKLFFCEHNRHVLFGKATRDFEIDGRYVESDGCKEIERRVRKGDSLIVRCDETRPAHNEVIFKEQYFLLGQHQLNRLREKMEVIL